MSILNRLIQALIRSVKVGLKVLIIVLTVLLVVTCARRASADQIYTNKDIPQVTQPLFEIGNKVQATFNFEIVSIRERSVYLTKGKEATGWIVDSYGKKVTYTVVPLENCRPVKINYNQSIERSA